MTAISSTSERSLTPAQLAALVEFGEAEAYADMFQAAPPELGLRVARVAGAVALTARTVPIALFNRVIGLGLREGVTDEDIQTSLDLFKQAGVADYAIQVSPAAQSRVPHLLGQHGLHPLGHWAKMYRRPDGEVEVSTSLRIEQIGPAQAETYAGVVLAAFGMPPFLKPWLMNLVARANWHHYLAFEGDNAVAAGSLFVRDGLGWLGIGGTHPAYRRRGGQGALMARRIRAAAALGCEWVITETGKDTPAQPNPSFHNMVRTGFQLAYQRPNYGLWSSSR